MDRPSSPRTGTLGPSVPHLYGNSPKSSPRKVLFSLGLPQSKATERQSELAPRPTLVQQHLQRFQASLEESDAPKVYTRQRMGRTSKSSVDISPQVRAMGAINQERMAVDSSSLLGPRPSWQDTRPHVAGGTAVHAEYVAKLDQSFQRTKAAGGGGASAARIAMIAQMGSLTGSSEVRSWGSKMPPTSALWSDIAELRGARRLRQYIQGRKREGEAPLELLTDLADGWEQLRERQRHHQGRPLQETPSDRGSVCGAASAAVSGTTSHVSQAAAAAVPPPPIVFVAESDWSSAAAAAADAAGPASAAPPASTPPGLAAATAAAPTTPPYAQFSTASIRVLEGSAKPVPTSVVLVHFPQKPPEGGGAAEGGGGAAAAWPAPPSSCAAPRRSTSFLQAAGSVHEYRGSLTAGGVAAAAVGAPAGGSLPRSLAMSLSGGTAAAAASAAGFVPGVERYHTTYTLPSRALSTVADRLSPRSLVGSTRLVEVVEVVHPPRMRQQHLRISEGSGAGVGGTAATDSADVPPVQYSVIRRHSVADPTSWAAGARTQAGSSISGISGSSQEGPKLRPLGGAAAWATAAAVAAIAAVGGSEITLPVVPRPRVADQEDEGDGAPRGAAGTARSDTRVSFEAAAMAVMQAQRWKRLAASPGGGTQVDPAAFERVAAATAEATSARKLGFVPALATSASQIVVMSVTPGAAGWPSGPSAAMAGGASVPLGPKATKRMRSHAAAQLQKRWSLKARSAPEEAPSPLSLPWISSTNSINLGRTPAIAAAAAAKDVLTAKYDNEEEEEDDDEDEGGGASLSTQCGSMTDEPLLAVAAAAAGEDDAEGVFVTSAAGVARAMDIIPEEAADAEGEAEQEEEVSELRHQAPKVAATQSEPGGGLAATHHSPSPPAGLPPRPPPHSLRSRSLVSIPTHGSPNRPRAGSGSGDGGGGARSTGGGVGSMGRRVRISEPAGALSAESSSAALLRQQSLRRLLSDHLRVAAAVYAAVEVQDGEGHGAGSGKQQQHHHHHHQESESGSELEQEHPRREPQPALEQVQLQAPLQVQAQEQLQPCEVSSLQVSPDLSYRYREAQGRVSASASGGAALVGLASAATDPSADCDPTIPTHWSLFTVDSSAAPFLDSSAPPSTEPSWTSSSAAAAAAAPAVGTEPSGFASVMSLTRPEKSYDAEHHGDGNTRPDSPTHKPPARGSSHHVVHDAVAMKPQRSGGGFNISGGSAGAMKSQKRNGGGGDGGGHHTARRSAVAGKLPALGTAGSKAAVRMHVEVEVEVTGPVEVVVGEEAVHGGYGDVDADARDKAADTARSASSMVY